MCSFLVHIRADVCCIVNVVYCNNLRGKGGSRKPKRMFDKSCCTLLYGGIRWCAHGQTQGFVGACRAMQVSIRVCRGSVRVEYNYEMLYSILLHSIL